MLDFDENWRARVVPLSKGTEDGRIPVINLTPAGNPLDYEESYPNSAIGYASIDPPPSVVGPNLFAFVIVGKSMVPDYPEGYYAICRPTPADEIEDGAAVFVRFGATRDHTCTFKRAMRVDEHRVELRPINPRWKPEVGLGQRSSEKFENILLGMNSAMVSYGYSEMSGGANRGRLTSSTYPDGRLITRDYDTPAIGTAAPR